MAKTSTCCSPSSARRAAALLCLLAALAASASVRAAEPYADKELPPEVARTLATIAGKDIVDHARILCDPEFRGRRAGSAGVRLAAQHVADDFRAAGLRPGGRAGSYYQVFQIRPGYRISATLDLSIGDVRLDDIQLGRDFMPVHLPGGKAKVAAGVVLAGYGITAAPLKFDEYRDLDARGNAALVFSGAPWSRPTDAWVRPLTDAADHATLGAKARNAAAHGAVCLLLVDDPSGWRKKVGLTEELKQPDVELPPDSPIPVIHLTRQLAARLAGMSIEELRRVAAEIARERAPRSQPPRGRRLAFEGSIAGEARLGRNIVGVLPGRDEKLRTEAVVIGAHYDHLGEGPGDNEIFFGANDNAAGVGALIAAAQAAAALPKPPRRTLVFVAFDAEEIRRLGSKYYVAHPAIPIERTVLMINFDMIGRNEPDAVNAVATRSSNELDAIHQAVNRHVGLTLVHPLGYRLGRSDHSPFYFAGVPIMYLFGGLDPDYNTPRDTWDKLIPGKVEKVARLAFLTALSVAERDERIRFRAERDDEPPPDSPRP